MSRLFCHIPWHRFHSNIPLFSAIRSLVLLGRHSSARSTWAGLKEPSSCPKIPTPSSLRLSSVGLPMDHCKYYYYYYYDYYSVLFYLEFVIIIFLISFSGISSDGIVFFFFFRFSFPPFSDFISILFYYCFFFLWIIIFPLSLSLSPTSDLLPCTRDPPQWIAYDERSTWTLIFPSRWYFQGICSVTQSWYFFIFLYWYDIKDGCLLGRQGWRPYFNSDWQLSDYLQYLFHFGSPFALALSALLYICIVAPPSFWSCFSSPAATLLHNSFQMDGPITTDSDYTGGQRPFSGPISFPMDDEDHSRRGSAVGHPLAQPVSIPATNGLRYNTQQSALQDVP